MVILGEEKERERNKLMKGEGSNPMASLKWGRQRYLRCIKLHSNAQLHPKRSASDLIGRRGSSYPKQNLKMSVGCDGMSAIREKVMLDIQMAADKTKRWNLRCKAPNGKTVDISPLKTETKSMRLRGPEKRERSKFSVSLSWEEIEQDFMGMAGKKLPRQPTKRPKTLQKQLDKLLPSSWLTEITANSYKIPQDAKS